MASKSEFYEKTAEPRLISKFLGIIKHSDLPEGYHQRMSHFDDAERMIDYAGQIGVLANRDRSRFVLPLLQDIYSIQKHAKDMKYVLDSCIDLKFTQLIQAIEDGEARKRKTQKVEKTEPAPAAAKEQETADGWTLVDKRELEEDWQLL